MKQPLTQEEIDVLPKGTVIYCPEGGDSLSVSERDTNGRRLAEYYDYFLDKADAEEYAVYSHTLWKLGRK